MNYHSNPAKKSIKWILFLLAMLVLPAIACDENDVRDNASDVYYNAPISAQCSDINIYGKTEGQCK